MNIRVVGNLQRKTGMAQQLGLQSHPEKAYYSSDTCRFSSYNLPEDAGYLFFKHQMAKCLGLPTKPLPQPEVLLRTQLKQGHQKVYEHYGCDINKDTIGKLIRTIAKRLCIPQEHLHKAILAEQIESFKMSGEDPAELIHLRELINLLEAPGVSESSTFEDIYPVLRQQCAISTGLTNQASAGRILYELFCISAKNIAANEKLFPVLQEEWEILAERCLLDADIVTVGEMIPALYRFDSVRAAGLLEQALQRGQLQVGDSIHDRRLQDYIRKRLSLHYLGNEGANAFELLQALIEDDRIDP